MTRDEFIADELASFPAPGKERTEFGIRWSAKDGDESVAVECDCKQSHCQGWAWMSLEDGDFVGVGNDNPWLLGLPEAETEGELREALDTYEVHYTAGGAVYHRLRTPGAKARFKARRLAREAESATKAA